MTAVRNPDHKPGREMAFTEPEKPWQTQDQKDKAEVKKDTWYGT